MDSPVLLLQTVEHAAIVRIDRHRDGIARGGNRHPVGAQTHTDRVGLRLEHIAGVSRRPGQAQAVAGENRRQRRRGRWLGGNTEHHNRPVNRRPVGPSGSRRQVHRGKGTRDGRCGEQLERIPIGQTGAGVVHVQSPAKAQRAGGTELRVTNNAIGLADRHIVRAQQGRAAQVGQQTGRIAYTLFHISPLFILFLI